MQPQQEVNNNDKSLVIHAADSELADDMVQVPQLSVLAELDDDVDETGDGLLLDECSSDKTEEL